MPEESVVVIGGGFFGVSLALHLARRSDTQVTLLEAGDCLLGRASRINQARIHQGYHYPRSYVSAYRSRKNFPRFVQEYHAAVRRDFRSVYAIAREDSKISVRGFVSLCRDIGAPLEVADSDLTGLFDRRRIEAVFVAQEYAFDAVVLREMAEVELASLGVEVRLNTAALAVGGCLRGLSVALMNSETLGASAVLNCTYSRLNTLQRGGQHVALKHELAELALMRMPAALLGLGVTVMDGPFFSVMPYPSRELHSLTHVRYTPHRRWEGGENAPRDVHQEEQVSQVQWMQRDAARYLPAVADAVHIESLYEVKTVLASTELDDARPILWRSDSTLPGYHAVLGAKLDNIYDLLEQLDRAVPQHHGA
ncbi:FAD-dependent oxidoreductase [Deinococcus sp. UYEF24]